MDKSKQTLLKLVKYNFFSPKKFSSVSKFSTPKEFLEIDKNLVRKFEEIQKKIGFIPNIFYLFFFKTLYMYLVLNKNTA